MDNKEINAIINRFKKELWHNVNEEPEIDKPILLKLLSNDYVVIKLRSKYNVREYPYNKASCWLYIEDLRKEERI